MSSSDVSSVSNHFPTAAEGFVTTTGGSVNAGAATVPLNSTSGLTNGKVFVGIIEPGTSGKQQTFTGLVDTSGSQITNVAWTRGTNTSHSAGVSVVDYVTGTAINMITKGLLVEHSQDGTHGNITPDSVTTPSLVVSSSATLPANSITPSNLSPGAVVQIVCTIFSAVATGTTVLPWDDTIPQNTEGDQYMTQTITPISTTNRLSIEVTAMASTTAGGQITSALFQDSTVNALAAIDNYQTTTTGVVNLKLIHDMAAGTTTATTFKVRIGCETAATVTFNGQSGARKFGGIPISSIRIIEYKA